MTVDERKRKIAYAERGLSDANRRLKRTMTSVRFWERKLRTQERALLKELEVKASLPMDATGVRRFRD
jgi:hypothetical protein